MKTWEEFELQCTDYLNAKFGTYAKFIHQGGPDSTVPDILVHTNTGKSFYIEAKHTPAQCGQFVLLPNINTKLFEYSHRNDKLINNASAKIMNFMNESFDEFRNAGTAGKDINMMNGPFIFADWIIKTYKDKGVTFLITNNYKLLPIDCLGEYFDISATYRIKRSGSGSVGRSNLDQILNHVYKLGYTITNSRVEADKLFVSTSQQLHGTKFILNGFEYMFSLRGKEYELRKLSNTYNANVIFSIKLRESVPGMIDDKFIDVLK